jgi:hypothetical protein
MASVWTRPGPWGIAAVVAAVITLVVLAFQPQLLPQLHGTHADPGSHGGDNGAGTDLTALLRGAVTVLLAAGLYGGAVAGVSPRAARYFLLPAGTLLLLLPGAVSPAAVVFLLAGIFCLMATLPGTGPEDA